MDLVWVGVVVVVGGWAPGTGGHVTSMPRRNNHIHQESYFGCEIRYGDEGKEALCESVDPSEVLRDLDGISKLTLLHCAELGSNVTLPVLPSVKTLVLKDCSSFEPNLVGNFQVFNSLLNLEIRNSNIDLGLHCDVIARLEDLVLSGLSLAFNPLTNCTAPNLKALDLSGNRLETFDLGTLAASTHLEVVTLGSNRLSLLSADSTVPLPLYSLNLWDNPALVNLCPQVFTALPRLRHLDISETGVVRLPASLLDLTGLAEISHAGVNLVCDCQTTLRLAGLEPSLRHVYSRMNCSNPVSGTRFNITDHAIIDSLDCGQPEIIGGTSDWERERHLVSQPVLLDCDAGDNNHETLWLSPRNELVRQIPGPGSCPAHQDKLELADTSDYTDWPGHYTILQNGSLLIDKFGWRDRGSFQCYVDNGIVNDTKRIYLALDYQYRNDIYYMSLAFGFGGAACFLGLTLLAKLLQYLLWNYGCCQCCPCCKDQLPPKTKRLTKVVDSIETYRIQQLEQLRDNYNQHSQRIRDNCALQMEKVRENYNSQMKSVREMKNLGSAGVQGLKDQYNDQISKIREYSSSQLDRCHENYIFQRQRLRKFSAQNYLRVRETKKYTQKTLNRVLDNMPALYLDLSSCKQGLGDQDLREWQEEMDKREAEMRDLLSINLAEVEGDQDEDSPSLYFTPSGTPCRESNVVHTEGCDPKSPSQKGHKRGVSSLSQLLPFWWSNNQQETVETVAIVETPPEGALEEVVADEVKDHDCDAKVEPKANDCDAKVEQKGSDCDAKLEQTGSDARVKNQMTSNGGEAIVPPRFASFDEDGDIATVGSKDMIGPEVVK